MSWVNLGRLLERGFFFFRECHRMHKTITSTRNHRKSPNQCQLKNIYVFCAMYKSRERGYNRVSKTAPAHREATVISKSTTKYVAYQTLMLAILFCQVTTSFVGRLLWSSTIYVCFKQFTNLDVTVMNSFWEGSIWRRTRLDFRSLASSASLLLKFQRM